MAERQTLEEAVAELKATLKPIVEPPLLRLMQALQRHIDRHPRFYRVLRVTK